MRPYTYIIRDEDGTPFYVGKGRGGRCGSHLRRPEVHRAAGARLTIEVEFCSSDDEAFSIERQLIHQHDNPKMLNITKSHDLPISLNLLLCIMSRDAPNLLSDCSPEGREVALRCRGFVTLYLQTSAVQRFNDAERKYNGRHVTVTP